MIEVIKNYPEIVIALGGGLIGLLFVLYLVIKIWTDPIVSPVSISDAENNYFSLED